MAEMDARLPAHLEVGGWLRRAQAVGGFGTVIRKGERDAGTILILTIESGRNACAFERMPTPDGAREWVVTNRQGAEKPHEFDDWLTRRGSRDPDLWVIELDTPLGERLVAESGTIG